MAHFFNLKGFLEEFKAFALKGNVIDLAVAVVIGGAFNKIVSVFVSSIITPIIGYLTSGVNLAYLVHAGSIRDRHIFSSLLVPPQTGK